MKNYRESDYAINKYSKSIVYRFADRIVEVTLKDYLAENPGKTESDFLKLKALSDEIFFEQDRAENAQTKKNLSIHDMEETEECCTSLLEEQYIDEQEIRIANQAAKQLVDSNLLTDIQKRRFVLYFFDGLTTRQIARIEGTAQYAVWKSINASEKKLKKLFDDGWSNPA
jgi:DNA-directed RNA polymerase specialized sigma24 family protein